MSENSVKKYSLDTSAILQISKTYPQHLFPKVWGSLENAAESGKLFVLDKVYAELARKDDFSHKWLKDRKKKIIKISTSEIELKAAEVISNFEKLIDPESEHEQADPFIIADGILDSLVVIVTCESPYSYPLQINRKKDKIPNVCDHFKIEVIKSTVGGERVIIELFEALGFTKLG